MSLSHIIDTGSCPPAWTKIRGHRIHSCTDLQFDRDLIGLLRLNGNIPPGNPRTFLHTDGVQTINWKTFTKEDIPAGADGDYLQTIAGVVEWAPPTFGPSALTPGDPYQLLQTNAAGTAAEWTDNVQVQGNLTVEGSTLLKSNVNCDQTLTVDGNTFCGADLNITGQTTATIVDITGNLLFNGVSGTANQYLKKTGAATQSFQNIIASDITAGTNSSVLSSFGGVSQWIVPTNVRKIVCGTTFTAQNLNQVGPVAATFSTLQFMNIASSTVAAVVGITQPSATQFTIGTTGNYNVNINGYIDPASTGLGNSIVTLSVEVGGTESQRTCIVCNGNYSFSGDISFLATAGQIVRIILRRVVGTGTLNTFAEGAALPNYASTILFSLLNL